jgi:DNA polymerase (family 10)
VVTKRDILALLDELAALTILDEGDPQSFRVRAYENARRTIEAESGDVVNMSEAELVALKGIGKSTAAKIREFVSTGRSEKLELLRTTYPPEFVRVTRIPGIGPKTARRLRDELKIENLEGLEAALDQQLLRDLPGFGPAKEEKIGRAIEQLGLRGKELRFPIAEAWPVAAALVEELRSMQGVGAAQFCGSLRRFRETVADVDVVVAAADPDAISGYVPDLPIVAEVLGHGATKTSFITTAGLQVDVRVVAPEQYGAATQYFTGSKAHNIAVRQIALSRGLTLNEYGLVEVETGEVVASATEEDIYRSLGLQWIPPPMREGIGEIELAAAGNLPTLVQLDDIRGDLHDHTDRSGDGRASLGDMVRAAHERRFEYLAITDHGEDLTINGVARSELLQQRTEIAELQKQYPDLRILHGCELNISVDGSVDYDAEFLAGFDWCVASVHDRFDRSADDQTIRLITAMQNPAVNAIGHLSGRMIGRRPGIEFDVEAVLEAAALTGTAIEINGALERLDATPEVIRTGIARGVYFVISTDSHHPSEMRRMEWGISNAQRGWLTPDRVINTWPVERFLEWIDSPQ